MDSEQWTAIPNYDFAAGLIAPYVARCVLDSDSVFLAAEFGRVRSRAARYDRWERLRQHFARQRNFPEMAAGKHIHAQSSVLLRSMGL